MNSGLTQIVADAEHSVRHLKFARLRRGQYIDRLALAGETASCCMVGAAALLFVPVREIYRADKYGDRKLLERLKARYGLTIEHVDGLVDGFDGCMAEIRSPATLASPDYAEGKEAGRQFAERMKDYFS